jgi:small subunit ribosomal protein S1
MNKPKNILLDRDIEKIVDQYKIDEKFSDYYKDFEKKQNNLAGHVTKATIRDINKEKGFVLADVGLKSEARIDIEEFRNDEINVGDIIDVYIYRYENSDGVVEASRERAKREEVWQEIEKKMANNEIVIGKFVQRVKGGYSIDLNGVPGFMPGSQVDVKPLHNPDSLIGQDEEMKVLSMDKTRYSVVVSRRALIEKEREKVRSEMIKDIKVGDVLEGVVKNITDYGVFIDLGGIDGLLHVTDISWKRINHASEIVKLGDKIKVMVIEFDKENQRVSLGLKQLEEDPWKDIEGKFEVGKKYKGKVSSITDYGAFVEIDKGIEGLVHVSEMSWTKKNIHPSQIVNVGDEVEVMILEMDLEKRRISLGMKQCKSNPWEAYAKTHKVGNVIEGEIKNITDFGMFIGLTDELDGIIHLSDLDWAVPGEEAIKQYNKGDKIKAQIIDLDPEKERVALSIKHLKEDKVGKALENIKKGSVVTCIVKEINDDGITVTANEVYGFIPKSDLSKTKSEQRSDRFAVGEKVDAKVINIDKDSRKLKLSIKAHEIDEEKKMMKQYGSAESGAVLGDILGVALEEKDKKDE